MVISNSTPNSLNTHNELIINTASITGEDLSQFIQLSEEIEQRRAQRFSLPANGTALLKATMTREEIFESSSLDDDDFLTALEHQNSYVTPRVPVTDLDLSSIENLMRYFDEDVPVTPTKAMTTGKVASAIANFKSMAEHVSPKHSPKKQNENKTEIKANILELKKKYEMQARLDKLKTPPKQQTLRQIIPKTVKEITQLFNAKINQVVKRGTSEMHSYMTLVNEESPEIKPAPKPRTSLGKPRAPLSKPSNKLPNLRIGLPSPVPSPKQSPRRRRETLSTNKKLITSTTTRVGENLYWHSPRQRRQALTTNKKMMLNTTTCLVAEDVFRQLSVKDKALLFNKFIGDMSKKNPKFTKHAEIIQENVNKQMAYGEVITERQATVKMLAQELEAKCVLNNSETTLKRAESVKYKKRAAPLPPNAESNAKEAEEQQKSPLPDDDSLHISTLTVQLKPSPDGNKKMATATKSRTNKISEFKHHSYETTSKRNISALHTTLPVDIYAPPKKIRRTRGDRMETKMFFQNEQLENLFYNWLKESNGILFDITAVTNTEQTIQITMDDTRLVNSTAEITQKSAVDRLLEEAIAKLEESKLSICAKQREEYENVVAIVKITTPEANELLPTQAQVNVEQPLESISNSESIIERIKTPAIATCKNVKREAPKPPLPTPRTSLQAASTCTSSTSSSAKQSDVESESGLSTLPKPPENELQKSHDHNPAALSEHQLRVQASLQRLNIPDWFRQYNQNNNVRSPDGTTANNTTVGFSGYKPGNFTRKRTQESGRWAGLNSKTTSLSSLGSQRSDRSPLLLSPSAHSHHSGQVGGITHQHYTAVGTTGSVGSGAGGGVAGFSRWSTSHLNSTQTSPSVSQRGSFARGGPINSSFISVASGNSGILRSSYRQPYLGWRSTEKLSQRTPHERLASSLLQQRKSPTQRTPPNALPQNLQAVTPEIQSSIKEVTSAIVHYVNDQTAQQQLQQRSRSASPNSRKCWLESSFVGVRPLDSPQTPVIENNQTTADSSTTASLATSHFGNQPPQLVTNNSNFTNTDYCNTASGGGVYINDAPAATNNAQSSTIRMNGLSRFGGGGAPERSLSSASLEDVLASLLGLPTSYSSNPSSTKMNSTDAGAAAQMTDTSVTATNTRSTTTGDSVSELQTNRQIQQLEVNSLAEQQRLRRRSESDATKQKQQQQQQQQQQTQQIASKYRNDATATAAAAPRRVSLGDSSDSQHKTTSADLQIKCRNTKCDNSATPADAKKFYKSCHNCTHLYCSRECRRAHWEKHRRACLHSRASNLCRQVLATCKDDLDSQRHLSLLARKGFLSQGRGVVRVLFRSAEAAEGFIKHGFQCMGEASYVRWPDLMPAEMGLELYSELLKLSTEYKPDSKMLIYVAICVVSEAPGMGQAPVRWERQLVSRCAKLKLCKSILVELEQQQQALQQPLAVVAVPERTEILILTFNPSLRTISNNRELILSNILDILSRRGVLLRKHYPEIYQRLQTYTEGQTDKFNPVTLHPRDSQTGQSFVCIIMPVHSDSEIIKLPSAADGGNRVTTIDVGSPAALAQLDDDELLTRTTAS